MGESSTNKSNLFSRHTNARNHFLRFFVATLLLFTFLGVTATTVYADAEAPPENTTEVIDTTEQVDEVQSADEVQETDTNSSDPPDESEPLPATDETEADTQDPEPSPVEDVDSEVVEPSDQQVGENLEPETPAETETQPIVEEVVPDTQEPAPLVVESDDCESVDATAQPEGECSNSETTSETEEETDTSISEDAGDLLVSDSAPEDLLAGSADEPISITDEIEPEIASTSEEDENFKDPIFCKDALATDTPCTAPAGIVRTTIQAAVDDATSAGVIYIEPGTFTGPVSIDNKNFNLVFLGGVDLGSGTGTTLVDAPLFSISNSAGVIRFQDIVFSSTTPISITNSPFVTIFYSTPYTFSADVTLSNGNVTFEGTDITLDSNVSISGNGNVTVRAEDKDSTTITDASQVSAREAKVRVDGNISPNGDVTIQADVVRDVDITSASLISLNSSSLASVEIRSGATLSGAMIQLSARTSGNVISDAGANANVTNQFTESATVSIVQAATVNVTGLDLLAETAINYSANSLVPSNYISGIVKAYIENTTVTAGAGGVKLTANDLSKLTATSLVLAVSFDTTTSNNRLNRDVSTYLKDATVTVTGGDIELFAQRNVRLLSQANSASWAGNDLEVGRFTFSLGSVNTILGSVMAEIVNGSVSTITSGIILTRADDTSVIDATSELSATVSISSTYKHIVVIDWGDGSPLSVATILKGDIFKVQHLYKYTPTLDFYQITITISGVGRSDILLPKVLVIPVVSVPVVSGQVVSIVCDDCSAVILRLPEGHQLNYGIGYGSYASLTRLYETTLPGELPNGISLMYGMDVKLFNGDRPVESTNGPLVVSFVVPEILPKDDLAILFWDKTVNGGQGDWVEMPTFFTEDGDITRINTFITILGTYVLGLRNQLVPLDCADDSLVEGVALYLIDGSFAHVPCDVGDTASLIPFLDWNLPEVLPENRSFVSGMQVSVYVGGTPASSLPLGEMMAVNFMIPEEDQGKDLVVVHWDGSQWVELETTRSVDENIWASAVSNDMGIFILVERASPIP